MKESPSYGAWFLNLFISLISLSSESNKKLKNNKNKKSTALLHFSSSQQINSHAFFYFLDISPLSQQILSILLSTDKRKILQSSLACIAESLLVTPQEW